MSETEPTQNGERPADEAEADPAMDRARRYLDLWERHLAHLAVRGPAFPRARGQVPPPHEE